MTKSSNGQPIEFEPIFSKPNNRQTIFFNYDSIVDFSIGIQESVQPSITTTVSQDDSDEILKAEIEGKFLFNCRNTPLFNKKNSGLLKI